MTHLLRIGDNELYQIVNPGNLEELKKYESVNIFTTDDNNEPLLIKVAKRDFDLGHPLVTTEGNLINLFIRLKDRINLIRKKQEQLNVDLKKSLRIDMPKAKAILTSLVDVTLSEPRTELLSEIKETIDLMLKEYLSNPEVVTRLVQVSIHDYSTSLHLTNCMLFCFGYAHYCKYSKHDMKELGLAALLHDVGKIEVPDYLLQASRKLTDDEFEIIKRHTTAGYSLIESGDFSDSVKLATIEHHERLDGTGYPNGRMNLHETSKVIGIVDVFEALTHWRPYKKEMDALKALNIIKTQEVDKGRFDGKIFKQFAQSLVGMKLSSKAPV